MPSVKSPETRGRRKEVDARPDYGTSRCPWPCNCERGPINRVWQDENKLWHIEQIATAVKCRAK